MIIDVHAHIMDRGYPPGSDLFIDADSMVDAMDRHGIAEMWVSPAAGLVREFWIHNKRQYEKFKNKYPSRFKHYAVFNPYYPEKTRDGIKRCFEDYGFHGIKIHNWLQGLMPHQKAIYELVEASIKYHVPVLFHDGTPPYSDTLQLAGIAERYPEALILLGHAGLFDSYRAAIQAANMHDNVWLVLMGPIVGDMKEVIDKTRTDRLLFGTDYCFGGTGWKGDTLIIDRIEIIKQACSEKNVLDQIMFQNAKILSIRDDKIGAEIIKEEMV